MYNTLPDKEKNRRKRFRLMYKLEALLEAPMFFLSVLWVFFLVLEIFKGLTLTQEHIVLGIWGLFILEFLVKFTITPDRWQYIKQNWLTVVALLIPALRVFRLVQALRILRFSRVTTSTYFVRALTSGNRFIGELKEAQGPEPEPEMNVGIMLAFKSEANREQMHEFARQLAKDVNQEMESVTGIKWIFHETDPVVLESNKQRQAAHFLDDASLRMAEGPFDLLIVITNVGLLSRRRVAEPGLSSDIGRVVVISTRRLTHTGRDKPNFDLASEAVRINAATLLLHLLGHIGGLNHKHKEDSPVMAPFAFLDDRKELPRFTASERKKLHKRGERMPERELHGGNIMETFIFHLMMAFRHPLDVVLPLFRNWALLLPLSLPGLATAAVAPCFVLVFTAEIWDVGINMSSQLVAIYATISVVCASIYLVNVQKLLLPRKDKRVLTEHMAVANTVIFLSMLFACIGLFLLVGGLMFIIEIYIFPESLMKTWPTLLDQPNIGWEAKLRLAAFISTVGVTTGALAGGLDSRAVIQHLALFNARP